MELYQSALETLHIKTLLEIKKAMGIDYFDNDNFEKEQIAKYAK